MASAKEKEERVNISARDRDDELFLFFVLFFQILEWAIGELICEAKNPISEVDSADIFNFPLLLLIGARCIGPERCAERAIHSFSVKFH